jgi:hypothetical protein
MAMCAFVVDVLRTLTISQFIEFDPPVDLDLRSFPGPWERLGDMAGSSGFLMVTLAVLVAAISSPRGVSSRAFTAIVVAVGLLMAVIVVAALTSGPRGVPWDVIGRSTGVLVAYALLVVAMRRGIGVDHSGLPEQVRSKRGSTGFGMLTEYE